MAIKRVLPREPSEEEWRWEVLVEFLREFFYEPDVQAVRAAYSAIAAHTLTNGQPVWPMLVAPPGSAKTTMLDPLGELPGVHMIDKVTSNTFLSGQIGQEGRKRKPSLLHRIGKEAIVIFPDFSTVLEMRAEDRAEILADLRRIYDGELRKETGTAEEPLMWKGRLTCAVAVTDAIDKHHAVFQALGERFVMVRWDRPGGDADAIKAALMAINQDIDHIRKHLRVAVKSLFHPPLPEVVTISDAFQKRIASMAEFVVRARTHVPRDYQRVLQYDPKPEAPTRLSQQLAQLAKGSARLVRRDFVTEDDVEVAQRVAFDCIPSIRARLLRALIADDRSIAKDIPGATKSLHHENLQAVGLAAKGSDSRYELTALAIDCLRAAQFSSLNLSPERFGKKKEE